MEGGESPIVTGIAKIQSRYRIQIPKECAEKLSLKEGELIIVKVYRDRIEIRRADVRETPFITS